MEENEKRRKHQIVQNTSPTAKLMDPIIELSQEQACNSIIKLPRLQFLPQLQTDYVLFQRVSVLQLVNNQTNCISSSSEVFIEEMRRWKSFRIEV